MSMRLDGKEIVDSWETWGVLRDDHLVEFDDVGEPGGAAITAEETARNYAKTYGGKVKKSMCFFTGWEDA